MDMTDLFVKDVMQASPYVIPPETRMEDAAKFMLANDITAAIVATDGEVTGILTNTDVLSFLSERPEKATVSEYLSEDVVVVSPNATVSESIDKMTQFEFQHLPVVTPENRVVGLLMSSDITEFVFAET